MHNLVRRLAVVGKIVPEHGSVLQIRLRVSLLRMNEIWKICGIPQKENWSIIEYPIPIAFLCVELDRESTRIPSAVGGALFATDSRESGDATRLLAHLVEHVHVCQVGDIICDFEFTVGSGTLGVDDTLGNALTIEVGKEVDQVEVLEQERTIRADALRSLWVEDGAAIGGGVNRLLVVAICLCRDGVSVNGSGGGRTGGNLLSSAVILSHV